MTKHRPRNMPLVGDPSPAAPEPYTNNSIVDELLTNMPEGMTIEQYVETLEPSQVLALGMALGAKATDMLGIKHCYQHYKMIPMGKNTVKVDYATSVAWCKNCYQYFRYKD